MKKIFFASGLIFVISACSDNSTPKNDFERKKSQFIAGCTANGASEKYCQCTLDKIEKEKGAEFIEKISTQEMTKEDRTIITESAKTCIEKHIN